MKKNKILTKFAPRIRSRHATHDMIRGKLGLLPVRSVIRFGSTTPTQKVYTKSFGVKKIVEINTVEAVRNSANKLLMKTCFTKAGVRTAPWATIRSEEGSFVVYHEDNPTKADSLQSLEFPLVSKHIFGSRGTGNKLHNSIEELTAWLKGKDLKNYIFEQYFTGVREYRLHISRNGCFYTCRKMLKQDTPDENRWYRNDDNSVWIMDTNPNFDRPVNWDAIVAECVKALTAVGLDVAAFDVRVQSTKTAKGVVRDNPEFIILESNSAPSFGNVTAERYREELPKLITQKL